MTDLTGGCFCGQVRFRITAAPIGVGVCHCLDCQKIHGGAPNYAALVPRPAFEVTRGEAKVYTCMADSGIEIGRAFCADCGSALWTIPGAQYPFFPVKLGALDDSSSLSPTLHLYTDSAQPWHLMHDGVRRYAKMPPVNRSTTLSTSAPIRTSSS